MTGHNRYKVMSNELEPKPTPSQTMVYQIRLKGHLDSQWTDWFEGLTITLEEDGDTLLTGPVVDQAALHGLLKKVRDLGMPLVSVNQVQINGTHSKKERKMNAYSISNSRKSARITGILFILGTVPVMVAMSLWGQSVSSPDYLSLMAAHSNEVLLLALSTIVMSLACTGIGISIYPILKPHDETLAIGVVGFRVMEGTLQLASAVSLAVLLALSQEFVKAGSPADSFFQPAAAVIKLVREWISNGFYLFPWCAGAAIYYTLFYRTRLLPRWLSVWGLLGLLLMLIGALSGMFGLIGAFSPPQMLLMFPIMLQEMVLAVWLIVKGYSTTAAAR
jgi:hypothetical protein